MSRLTRFVQICACVTALGGTAEAATVTLTWDRNPEPTVIGYYVSVGTSPGAYSQNINVGQSTTWTIPNLSAYQTYYFAVRAYDAHGQTSPYSMEVVRAAQAGSVPDLGTVAGIAPGAADLLWQHDDGWLSVWYMNGSTLLAANYLNPNSVSDRNYRIVGAGDFDRDGKVDLVWQHATSGKVVLWLMDGTTHRSSVTVDTVSDLNWKIVAVGDMNGDWYPDLIWQHGTVGSLAVWFMNGTSYQSASSITPNNIAPDIWKIVGVADFNLDGSTDVLWQHRDGLLSVWLMQGVTMQSAQYLSPASLNPIWKVVATADYNLDGRPDIVFQRDDGFLAVWFMNGLTMMTSPLLDPPVVADARWKIVGPK